MLERSTWVRGIGRLLPAQLWPMRRRRVFRLRRGMLHEQGQGRQSQVQRVWIGPLHHRWQVSGKQSVRNLGRKVHEGHDSWYNQCMGKLGLFRGQLAQVHNGEGCTWNVDTCMHTTRRNVSQQAPVHHVVNPRGERGEGVSDRAGFQFADWRSRLWTVST